MSQTIEIINNRLFSNSLIKDKNLSETDEVLDWIKERNRNVSVSVKQIPLNSLNDWKIEKSFSKIYHKTNHFFSIKGLDVETNYRSNKKWQQPIIDQPEVGILGFLTKEFNGVLHFLVQAKIEPGNINSVQISPTLQATKSNYTQKHKGSLPKYLNYFLNVKENQILYNQLQSEQGARFYKKLNRNIIIKTDDKIDVDEDFMWLSLSQIKKLSLMDNIINMDTRTVVSCINYKNTNIDYLKNLNKAYHTIDDILIWIKSLKENFSLKTKILPLSRLPDWDVNENEIKRFDGKYFKVIGADIKIENREVKNWQQPLIKPETTGIVALFMKKINNQKHYLINAKVECGHLDVVELGPSLSTSNIKNNEEENECKLFDIIKSKKYLSVKFDTLQSEEGGRFFHEENRNMLIEVDKDFNYDDKCYKWATLNQLLFLLNDSNIINIQLRSLISLINET
ncbi:NDP-hexose 2,3-dehydratase family protein [Candidatus Marinimicrobia bacterium]|nr:NDP-hexose 2,3-dehydratase family protein [Candidatus Neomarinimicrobiota bacterium]